MTPSAAADDVESALLCSGRRSAAAASVLLLTRRALRDAVAAAAAAPDRGDAAPLASYVELLLVQMHSLLLAATANGAAALANTEDRTMLLLLSRRVHSTAARSAYMCWDLHAHGQPPLHMRSQTIHQSNVRGGGVRGSTYSSAQQGLFGMGSANSGCVFSVILHAPQSTKAHDRFRELHLSPNTG